eukprot:TRINITY_DN36800_c0_g1_i1.p1 TRINITY_DN36800_c0_g1~~TRINITY_DN36800_c0_g1_i1.p1  ORF type:complete len:781 (+),score=115.99 TRINITY_DN36800_c0_g1_i1:70-2412(+)
MISMSNLSSMSSLRSTIPLNMSSSTALRQSMSSGPVVYVNTNSDGKLTEAEVNPHLVALPAPFRATMCSHFTGAATDNTALSLPAGTPVTVTKRTADGDWMLVTTMDASRSGLVPLQSLDGFKSVPKQTLAQVKKPMPMYQFQRRQVQPMHMVQLAPRLVSQEDTRGIPRTASRGVTNEEPGSIPSEGEVIQVPLIEVPKEEAVVQIMYKQNGALPADLEEDDKALTTKAFRTLRLSDPRLQNPYESYDDDAIDDNDELTDEVTSCIEVQEGAEVVGITPKVITKVGVCQQFRVVEGEHLLDAIGLAIDPNSGDLFATDKTVKKARGTRAFNFKVVLSDGTKDVATATTRIRVHRSSVKAMTAYYEQVFGGLFLALLVAIILRFCILDHAVKVFPSYLAALMNITFWTYVVSFVVATLYFSVVLACRKEAMMKDVGRDGLSRFTFWVGSAGLAVCMVMVLLQFQVYFGAVAYVLPHTLEYNIERITKPESAGNDDVGANVGPQQFFSNCFVSAEGCPQKDVVWKVKVDDGTFTKEKFLLRSKWSWLSVCKNAQLIVGSLVFKNAFTVMGGQGLSKMASFLLDLADVLTFWELLQDETVLINYWGRDIAGSGAVEHITTLGGNAGEYTMFLNVSGSEIVQTYSIKDQPDYSEAWWAVVFFVFIIGAVKASVFPVTELIPNNVVRHCRWTEERCYRIWRPIYHVLCLDVPFFAVRVALFFAFEVEPDSWMAKNMLFIGLAILETVVRLFPIQLARFAKMEVDELEALVGNLGNIKEVGMDIG